MHTTVCMALPGKQDIKALTGIRGIAALWVITFHYRSLPANVATPLNAVINHGYMAVDIFFVLSGFVMAMTYAHGFSGRFNPSAFSVFLFRRFARVYPLYILVLGVIGVESLAGMDTGIERWLNWRVILANVTMTQSWGLGESFNFPSWSVSAELAAYLLFPLLVPLTLLSRRGTAVAMTVLCLATMLWLECTPLTFHGQERRGPMDIAGLNGIFPVLRCLAEFSLGLIAYRVARTPAAVRFANSSFLNILVAAGLCGSLAIPNSDYVVVVLAPLMIIGLTGSNLVSMLAGLRAPVFLGEISYSLYMLHSQLLPVRYVLHARLDPVLGVHVTGALAAPVFYGTLLVTSWSVYRLVESPARDGLRRMEKLVRDSSGFRPAAKEAALTPGFTATVP